MSAIKRELLNILDSEEIGKEKTDAVALLLLYYKSSMTRSKEKISNIKVDEAAEKLSISARRVRKAKKTLMDFGKIQSVSKRNPLGCVEHYIKILDFNQKGY